MTTPWRHYETRDEAEMVLTGLGYHFACDMTPVPKLEPGKRVDCYAPQLLWETEDGQQMFLTEDGLGFIIAEPRQPI